MRYQVLEGARLSAFLVYRPSRVGRPIDISPPHFRFPLPGGKFSEPLGRKRRCTHGALQAGQSVSHNTNDVFVVGKCTQQWPKSPPLLPRFSSTILPSPMTTHPSKSQIRFLPSEERRVPDNVKQVLAPRTSSLMCLLKDPVRREHVVKSPKLAMQKCTKNKPADRQTFPNPAVSRSVVHVAVAIRRWPNQDAPLQVKDRANTFEVVWRLGLIEAGRKASRLLASNSLCLTSSLGGDVATATLAAALLKSAATCVLRKGASLTTAASPLHATPTTTNICPATSKRGVATAKSIWPRSAFFHGDLFCADSMRVCPDRSIVSSGICKLHEGTVLSNSVFSCTIRTRMTHPLPRNIKILEFPVLLEL